MGGCGRGGRGKSKRGEELGQCDGNNVGRDGRKRRRETEGGDGGGTLHARLRPNPHHTHPNPHHTHSPQTLTAIAAFRIPSALDASASRAFASSFALAASSASLASSSASCS